MKLYRLALPVLVMLFATTSLVMAHAELRHSEPDADAILDQAPMEVFAWFSEPLSTGSKLSVFDSQFQTVDKGETFIDASDATLMRVQLQPLGPGRYTVNWRATAIDGHVSSGSYDFVVRESAVTLPIIIGAGAAGLVIIAAAVWLVRRQIARRAAR